MISSLAAFVAAATVLNGALAATAPAADPCAKIAGQLFVPPADVLACYRSFPFNTTLQTNVVTAISRVIDFYSFEDYYYNSPPPFHDSTVNIRGELASLGKNKYKSDYDFNAAVVNFTTSLNDGHTGWYPNCYQSFQTLLPAPITIIETNGKVAVRVVPDLVEFISLLPANYTGYFDKIGYNWKRLAGAEVLEIEDKNAFEYVDQVASDQSGNYLDKGERINSVVSSYRIQGAGYSQRFGDLAGNYYLEKTGLKFKVIVAGSSKAETVYVPFLTQYLGTAAFTDKASYWALNCAAKADTNGVDYYEGDDSTFRTTEQKKFRPVAKLLDATNGSAVGLPVKYQPTLPTVGGNADIIRSYILPGNTTGVMFIGSFSPASYEGFQTDVDSAIKAFQAAGVKKLLIDLSNNGGGYICLGQFLHQYLAGSKIGYPGFQTTLRANELAKKVVAAQIKRGKGGNYFPSGNAFLNDTIMPDDYNYFKPSLPFVVNGRYDPTSQRYHDVCTPFDVAVPENPPFEYKNIAIIGNMNCASTCSMFSSLMYERHGVRIASYGYGGSQSFPPQIGGMAGNQVLEFADLKSEIKTAFLNNDTLAPPDLLVDGNMRVNWRNAWSYLNLAVPIAYVPERAHYRFQYTNVTYNNPQALWIDAAKRLFA